MNALPFLWLGGCAALSLYVAWLYHEQRPKMGEEAVMIPVLILLWPIVLPMLIATLAFEKWEKRRMRERRAKYLADDMMEQDPPAGPNPSRPDRIV